jgi:hypothetical protein
MGDSTIIKSAHDDTTLEFLHCDADHFKVSLRGLDFHCTARVYSFEPRPNHLAGFFRDLAVHWRGWPGKKEWTSLEGELSLVATSDSTGHTSLAVRLRSGPYPFDWSLSVVLLIEAGQLESIASQVEEFASCDSKA